MSDKGSVLQKGGVGTNFEQLVQTAFLTTMIIHGNAPCIPSNEIIEVAFQTTRLGYATDDLLIIAKSSIENHRLVIQIKHEISFTEGNSIFQDVINAFWKDFNNTSLFDKATDKLVVIKSGVTKDERNHLISLLDWAKTKSNEIDFLLEANRIKAKKERLEILKKCLKISNDNKDLSDREIWEFLKCFTILEYDFDKVNSIDKTYFLNLIKLCKNSNTISNENEIWNSLFTYVSQLNPNGGSINSLSVPQELQQYFDSIKLNPLKSSIEKLIKPRLRISNFKRQI